MKKLIGIKVVKRQNVASPSAATPDVVNRERTSFRKNAGRVLAGRVTDWVLEWREGRRVEGIKKHSQLFLRTGGSAKRGLMNEPINLKSLEVTQFFPG